MKRFLSAFLLLGLALVSKAQENDSIIYVQSPSGRLSGLIDIQNLVNEGFNIWNREFAGHWAGVELGINGFLGEDYGGYPSSEAGFMDNDMLRSNTLNVNVIQYSKGIQHNRRTIGLVTGLGLNFSSYRLDNSTSLTTGSDGKIHPETLFFDSSQKSKLSSLYLSVPLLVEFQIPTQNRMDHLYISGGLTGFKRLETHTKVKYRKDGKRQKMKSPADYSINDYKVAATVRFGYRWVNLFASYDLAPLFEDRKGPVLHPWSVGLRLISF